MIGNGSHNLPRRLVLPLPPVRHLTQKVIFCPAQVGHFHDYLRADPMHSGQLERRAEAGLARRWFVERHPRYLQRREHAGQPRKSDTDMPVPARPA